MQYSQSLGHQQLQSRQLQASHLQHSMGQNQFGQGNQLRSHLGQFGGTANNALFSAAQTSANSQMIPNMTTMPSQTFLPRMQFGMQAGHPQRSHPSQMLSDQMFNMGGTNPTNMVTMQQQQHGPQGGFSSMPSNMASNTNLQSGMVTLQSSQNPNYPQQRQQNQQ